MILQEGEREGNRGVREASPILGEEKPGFPSACHFLPPGSDPSGSRDKGLGSWAWNWTHAHLWYLWLSLECPEVGRGPRGDELCPLGDPLQWGCGGGNSGGSSSIESKWEAAMEAELGEMDAEGRSERPP